MSCSYVYDYPTDCMEEEWAFVAPYLTLLPKNARQRRHELRAVFDAMRWLLRAGALYQQAQRWLAAGCFEQLADDLRGVLRLASGRTPEPSAVIFDSWTLRSLPESGERAGYDGAKRKKGSKLHLAVDTLGHFLALHVTPANADDRAQVGQLAKAVQAATGGHVDLAYADQGYTGEKPAQAAREHGIELAVVRLPEAKRGFVLLPRRWVVERSFAWVNRFRRLVKDYERYASTLADLHLVAFTCLMLKQAAQLASGP